MKTSITWLGGPGEPDSNEWNGVTFKVGEPVEIDDEYMLRKASSNAFYAVDSGAEPDDIPKNAAVADRMEKARAARKAKAEDTEKVDA